MKIIISRKEFHKRFDFNGFDVIKEKKELMSVERLFKEIKADAPFRNHNYMFNKKINLKKLEIQEKDGIQKKFPEIKTEGERYEKVKEEMLNDTYEEVPVLVDIDYPDVIYVDNGFHRIFIAHQLGMLVLRVKAKYGKFNLNKSITFGDLLSLMKMLEEMKIPSLKLFKKTLEKCFKKKPSMRETHSIVYGGEGKND